MGRVLGCPVVVDQTPKQLEFVGPGDGQAPSAEDVRLARYAVLTHAAEDWPHGVFCRNCRAPFPCVLHRWGRRMLTLAGWSSGQIDRMIIDFTNDGCPPRS